MKKFLFMPILAFVLALQLMLASCGAPKWELSASVKEHTVAPGSTFTVTVTTKNTGGDFDCDSAKKRAGATPMLYQDIGTGRVYLAFDALTASDEVRTVTFAGGEAVEVKWTFHGTLLDESNPQQQAAPAGKYTLKLSFAGKEESIENFIEIKTN